MVLSLITAKRKDRHSFGCCLHNPWISCLSEAIQIWLYPIVFAKRLICLSVEVFCQKLIGIYQKIVVAFYYMIDLLRLFQKRSFVLSSEHENQNVATIGTLLDQLMLSCK